MGSFRYHHIVPFEQDLEASLQKLKEREFHAGRYFPALEMYDLTPDQMLRLTPGAQHDSIEEAKEEAAEEGNRSILDIDGFSAEPEFCRAYLVPEEEVRNALGTDRPTPALIDSVMSFSYEENNPESLLNLMENWIEFEETVDRGFCYCLKLYEGARPTHLLYFGFSVD